MKRRLLITCLMSLIVIGVWAAKNENEPIIGITCTTGTGSFKLYTIEETTFQIDFGEGAADYTIKTTGTTISGSATSNSITVYGDAALLSKFETSNNSRLKALDFSKCTALTELSCSSCANLSEIILPSSGDNQLAKVKCSYLNLTSFDAGKCSKLKTLYLSNSSATLETLVLPENSDVLDDLTLMQCGLTTLDVSKYTNLTNLDCQYNYLTSVGIPENPTNNLTVECSYNYMIMPNFPEGEKITLYYMDQRDKVSRYTLEEKYTTNDVIDLSELYVSKKGIKNAYFPEGVYPTFTWRVNGSSDPLVEGEDYTMVEPGKFKFNKVPENNVYCIIASKAYPAYQDYNSPYRTTEITVEKGPDPIIDINCTTGAVSFKLYASEETTFQVDFGAGPTNYTVKTTGTTVSGSATSNSITVYGDAALLSKFEVSSNTRLQTLDFSKCTAMTELSCSSCSNLSEIILPSSDDNQLAKVRCAYLNLTSFDAGKCSKLKTLYLSNSSATLETLVLPENSDVLDDLTLMQCGLTTLDVSKYTNLTNLDCQYNYLTSVKIPENPTNNLSVDCSYNYMIMPNFPEGEKITLYYMDQRDKVSRYTLEEKYTTNDVIDLSELYVSKKGIKNAYFPEGVYPTFTWRVNGSSDPLVEGEDYTVVEPGKFKFNKIPENNVYCIIASKAYPAYQDYNSPYRTTEITVEKGPDPIIGINCTTGAVSFKLYASEEATFQVDFGAGPTNYTVKATGTTVSGSATSNSVTVYGDAALLSKFEVSGNARLQTLDFSKCTALTELSCSSCSNVTEVILPSSDDNQLAKVRCAYLNLTSFDAGKCSKLKTLYLSNSSATLERLVLPENSDVLDDLTLMQCGLTTLDVSKYTNLTNFDCQYNYLTSVGIPENPANNLSVDCSYNYMIMPNFPEGEKITLYYMDQRDKVSRYTLEERYATNDVIDLSELYVSKKGIKGTYFPEGVYPTFTWRVNGSSDPLVEGEDYTVVEPGKFKFKTVPENSVYCIIASQAYPAYQNYNSPYRTTDVTIEKGPDPVMTLTTSREALIGFSIGAIEDGTSIQIDWGDGNLVDKVINATRTFIQGTPIDTKVIRIYADAASIKEILLSYCDYLTDVDLSKCTALRTLSVKENIRIETIVYPEDVTTLENLSIDGSSIRELDIQDWSGLKTLVYNPSGLGTITLPDATDNLESITLKKLSLKTIDLNKYVNLVSLEVVSNSSLEELDVKACSKLNKLICRSNAKLATLALPTEKNVLTELSCEYTNLSSIDLKEYTHLQVLNCSKIKEVILPSDLSTLTSLTCIENGLKTLDVSPCVNLAYLDCSYNELTEIIVPENLNQVLEIDCSFNYMTMPNFPEGEKIKMTYIYQKKDVMQYQLENRYTTDDTIDFSDWYIKKKGLQGSYFEDGVYPTFEWYLLGSDEKLVPGADYTVTDGCKFSFTTVPDDAVYCVISSKAYPAYEYYNEPYKTTSCVITQGTGLKETNAEIAKVYASGMAIAIVPAKDCTYSIFTATGQAIANGKTAQSVEVPVKSEGIYMVCIRTADNQTKTYKIAVQ
ncbi:leucine-rich repeat protein [Bacteroides sp.]